MRLALRFRSLLAPLLAAPILATTASSAGHDRSALAEEAVYDDAAYTRPQQRIDIGGGRKMNLYCIGSGMPTVIFDSGLSDWGFTWALVQPRVALHQRACGYDRAGLGYSDPSHRPGTSANIVEDLHALLTAAHIAPPYVLVGHSFGGLNLRLYADRYFNQVAGMVLLDPSHEDGIIRIDADRNGQESRRYAAQVTHWRACLVQSRHRATASFRRDCLEPADPRYSAALNAARDRVASQPEYQQAQLSEVENYANGVSFTSVGEARRSYDKLPLVVLTAGRTIEVAGAQWEQMHREIAALSSAGTQRVVAGSGHYLQLDRPDLVVEAIEQVQTMIAASVHPAPALPAQK